MTVTSVTSGVTSSGLTISSGNELLVQSGGIASSTTVDGGGSLVVNSGGKEFSATISAGGTETISSGGSATGDQIYGTLTIISTGATAVSNETVNSGGLLNISKSATVNNTTLISGGTVDLLTGAATLAGNLTFSGGDNTLLVASVVNTVGTDGDLAAISGFSSTDKIDITALSSAVTTLSTVVSGGNTVAEVISGSSTIVEEFVFSGTTTYTSSTLSLVADSGGHAEIEYNSAGSAGGTTTSVTTSTAPGAYTETSGNTLLVLNGGSVSATTIDNGAFLVISSGGQDFAATILSGGTETVSAQGSATGDQIYGATTVDSGADVSSEVVQNGGTLVVDGGAVDTASTILAGGSETILGSATGDQIYGTQLVSAATAAVTGEIVENGGKVELFLAGATATGTTVLGSGTLAISGNATASNTVLSGGGTVELESPKATVAGSLTFSGGGNALDIASIVTASAGSFGEQAVISGFSSTDKIDVSVFGAAASTSYSSSGGNEIVTVSGSGSTENFIFSGTSTYTSNTLALVTSGAKVDLEYSSSGFDNTTSVTTPTAPGAYTETFSDTLLVLNGGSVSAATIDYGAFLVVNGGADYAAAVLAGATETVSAGSATGDQIYGATTVETGANVSSETVQNGGTLVVDAGAVDTASTILAGGSETVLGSATGDQIYGTQLVNGATATVSDETVQDGGTLILGGAATATNMVLNGGGTVELESPTASLTGSLIFEDGGNTLDVSAISSSGDGDQAVISGFSSTDKIVISGAGANPALSFSTSGGNETVTVSGGSGAETFIFSGTSTYTSNTLSLVSSGGVVDLETSVPTSNFNIPTYNPSEASTISAGPLAIYGVAVNSIAPTQMNEGFTEVGAKAAGFDLITSVSALEADLVDEIEPVVIGPGGQLYLLDGHHTFTALLDSVWGADNPTVYVNVIANYSGDTAEQFIGQMQANNWLLPLNDGVPQTVNPASGSISPPIPTSLTGLTSDVYRGLEYSILKQKDSKLFTTSSNITGSTGASTPGLDKMTGIYSDFLEAAAYQDADSGLGLPYLSPGDVALATQWNLNPASTTTLPNFSGTVLAAQLPGFILNENLVEGSGSAANTIYFAPGGISNATLAGNGSVDSNGNSTNGALAGNGTFTAITEFNAGTPSNPIWIGSANVGFILQLGNDNKFTVTLTGPNTYTGGTTILAGRLIIAGDSSLGAAPNLSNSAFNASLTFDASGVPTNVLAAVQADNGIIFNSLTEGNATLTIGTTTGGTFTTSRPIAVGSEAATIDVNGNTVTLNGPLITLGYDGVGLGVTSGFSPLTIDDLSSGAAGTLVLSTPSPYFYGDIIIGNVGTPTVDVTSDAALGYDGSDTELLGTVELNGGTLQTGASFTASERNINLEGGSQIDVDGNTTTWGSLTDVKRTLEIENSDATQAGAITFNNFTISQTSILQLAGPGNETVSFTNGIIQTDPQDTLVLNASSSAALGTTEQVFSNGPSTTLVDGIAPVWIVTNEGNSKGTGPYDFVTYGADGYVQENTNSTTLSSSTGSSVVELAASAAPSGNAAAYALNTNGNTITLGSGNTLTIGDGTDDAGLILATGSAISGGTLAFGTSQGIIWLSGSNPTISSEITGSNGLTFAGSGAVNLSTAAAVSGVITIDSGTVTLSAANIFANDVAGVELGDVKSHPANSILDLTASNAFTTLNSVGSKSAINLSNGATLTIGDTTNNLSSTLSSTITESGHIEAGALTIAGSGLIDISGGSLSLVVGSTVVVDNSAQLRVATGVFANSNFGIVLNGTSQLQFAQNGGGVFANAVSGTGELHLIGGTLQLTGINNTYSGGTVVETGSTLDLTTRNVSTGNANITDAGGLIVFDQDFVGTYSGVISDGQEMGTGPMESGSLDIDNSTNGSGGGVELTAVQAYSGATYVEAGTLTLDAVNTTIADSSGVTLGRVGGAVDGQTASLQLLDNNTLASLSSDAGNTTSVVLNGNTLTLDPGTGVSSTFGGTISDGSSVGNVIIDGTGTVTFAGSNSYSGNTTVEDGTLVIDGTNGNSAITVDNGGAIGGTGTAGAVTVDSGGTFAPGDPSTMTVASLTLESGSTFDEEIGGASPGTGGASGYDQTVIESSGTISLNGATLDVSLVNGFTPSTGETFVIISNETGSPVNGTFNGLAEGATLTLGGDLFQISYEGGSGHDVTLTDEGTAPCYCRGTLIQTDRGEVPAEQLSIGDKVITKSGEARSIKWIGRRSYGGRFALGRRDILPICIKAGALDDNVPRRDLWISPHHAMYFKDNHLDAVLIEAKDLVNGVSIVQADRVDSVEYFHIELDSHDVIIAEGALSESFIDDDSRGLFHNAHEYKVLHPEAAAGLEQYCAPRCEDGYEVEAARRRIALRAGLSATSDEPRAGTLRGQVDRITARRIEGWAQNLDNPEAPVCLDIYAGAQLIGQVLASTYRGDLQRAGLGSGRHSFAFTPPPGLVIAPDTVHVRRSFDGALLATRGQMRTAA